MLRVGAAARCARAKGHRRARCTSIIIVIARRVQGFPLAVVGCSRHPDQRYTLYPPGHIPYGRQTVVPYSPTGSLLQDVATGQTLWPDTLLGAAIDAAVGQRWPALSPAGDERRRRTQGCRLDLAGKLLGIHPDVDARTRERIATRVQVPTMTLRSAAGQWAVSWQARRAAVLAVLPSLPIDASLLDRILSAGAVNGSVARASALGSGPWDLGATPFRRHETP